MQYGADPKARALEKCLEVALDEGSLLNGLREYERATGVSARMLVHHFGSKDGLEAALLAAIESRLLGLVVAKLNRGDATLLGISKILASPAMTKPRRLLRLLLGRALGNNAHAAEILQRERRRWRKTLRPKFETAKETEAALFIIVGGAVDAMLAEIGK